MLSLILLLFTFNSYAIEKIYVIDTEIDFSGTLKGYKCLTGHYNATYKALGGRTDHGTLMAKVITRGLSNKEICLVQIKTFDYKQSGTQSIIALAKALKYLNSQSSGIVNMSLNGGKAYLIEYGYMISLLKKGFKLSLAAGNEGVNLDLKCTAFPARYFQKRTKNVRISSNPSKTSNYGKLVTHKDHMIGGTSFSTANTTNKWIKGK